MGTPARVLRLRSEGRRLSLRRVPVRTHLGNNILNLARTRQERARSDGAARSRSRRDPRSGAGARASYGWKAMEALGVVAPRGHPPGVTVPVPDGTPSEVPGSAVCFLRQG